MTRPRRLALLALALVVGAAAMLLAWAPWRATPRSGPYLRVEAVDEAERPLPGVEARLRGDRRWTALGAEGRGQLEGPTDLATWSSEKVASEVEWRAAFRALPPGRECVVERQADGTFLATAALEAHAVVELEVLAGPFGDAKAGVERDLPLERIEAIGGANVARPGKPVLLRIWRDMQELTVLVESEPTLRGDRTIARRRRRIEAPPIGQLRRIEIEPGRAFPIEGRVVWPESLDRRQRHGLVRVEEILPDESRIEHGTVSIEADGRFRVVDAGASPYALQLLAPYATAPEKLVGGGSSATLDALEVRPSVRAKADAFRADAELPLVVSIHSRPGVSPVQPVAWLDSWLETSGELRVPFDLHANPGARIRVDVPPRGDQPALRGWIEGGEEALAGAIETNIVLAPLATGSLEVALSGPEELVARGATLVLEPLDPHDAATSGPRRTTILPGLAAPPRVLGLAPGSYLARVSFAARQAAQVLVRVDLAADAVVVLEAAAALGGKLQVNERLAPDEADDLVLQTGDTQGSLHIPLLRGPFGKGWAAEAPLRPGAWRGNLYTRRTGRLVAKDITFYVTPGETTVVER